MYQIAIQLFKFILIGFVLSGTSALATGGPIHKKVLIYGRFRNNLDPSKTINPFELSLLSCVYPRLVRLDNKGNLRADLAQDWKFGENGKTLTFNLNPIISAPEVVHHFEHYMSHADPGFQRQLLKSVLARHSAIVAKSEHVLKFNLDRPYRPFLYLLTSVEFGLPVPPAADGAVKAFNGWTLAFDHVGQKYSLSRSSPEPVEVTFQMEPSLEKIKPLAESGEFDVVIGLPTTYGDNIPSFRSNQLATMNSQIIHLNPKSKSLQNPAFRATLKMKLQEIAGAWETTHPAARAQKNLVPRGILPPDYYTDIPQPKNKEFGFPGIEKFRPLKIWVPSDYFPPEFAKALENAKISSQKLFDVRYSLFKDVAKNVRKGEIDLMFLDPGAYFPDPDSYLEIWSQSISESGFPFPTNKLMSKIQSARFLKNEEERIRKYAELILKFEAENWVIPMFTLNELLLSRNTLDLQYPKYRYPDSLCDLLNVNPKL